MLLIFKYDLDFDFFSRQSIWIALFGRVILPFIFFGILHSKVASVGRSQ
ncbi:hypothetical protein B932_0944 [Gluconobacter oxydans H24]|nr:hypothetical protein B932_0944 [Gluconobacter oxydans H24]